MIVAQLCTNKTLCKLILALLACMSNHAYAFCFEDAGRAYNINPRLLKAISYTESRFNPKAINKANSNGSFDVGLMQINSSWFPRLSELGISSEQVKTDPCVNVVVGAWILAQNFQTTGEGWLAVGAYNAGYAASKSKYRDIYISLVKENLESLQE